MKANIVHNAVDNFLQRNNLNSSILHEVCEKFLWESIRELRKEDPFLYEEMYNDYSTKAQTRFLEERLEMEFFDEARIIEELSKSMYRSLSRALEINECTEENTLTILEDCCSFLAEDSARVQQILESDDENKLSTVFHYLAKKLPSILPLIGTGFAVFGPLGLGTSLYVLLGTIVASAAGMMSGRVFGLNMQKEQLELLRDSADIIRRAAKAVKDGTEGIKHRYNVIYKNEEECYKRAGLDPQKMGLRMFAALKDESIFRQLLFFKQEEKLDTLRNCYMEHYLEKIGIFFDLYFDCLRKTGKWNEVREMNDDKIISMFRMKGGLYPMCDEYRDNAVKAIRNFEDLVKFFFEKSPDQKSKWMLMLNRYILDAKTSRDEQMRQHRDSYDKSKQSPFTSKKYRRFGQDT